MHLDWPHLCNCLFWAWYRYRIRPILLIRKRGRANWRRRGGYYIKRHGLHGLFAHRLWSRNGTIMWGYTTEEGWRWRSHLGETWRAVLYPGRVAIEETGQHRRRPHALVAAPRRQRLASHAAERGRDDKIALAKSEKPA